MVATAWFRAAQSPSLKESFYIARVHAVSLSQAAEGAAEACPAAASLDERVTLAAESPTNTAALLALRCALPPAALLPARKKQTKKRRLETHSV